ncbi:hypothetical protein Pint_20943 [Pistacia integerrima]|uniref:Uncharacterized protein n=1 Tax=Pistacia integerrima TaxID=434235 RepID=A0ACC0XAM5_9ROSI|nr:hypothetical protein Pint_20943 [Pistacia integerrima]
MALSFSSISVLIFLSILTSRYVENDFLTFLPLRLVQGLLTLCISIATMMVAFISSFFLAYNHHRSYCIPIISTVLLSLPIFVLCYLQKDILTDVLYLLFRFKFSEKPGRRNLENSIKLY